MLRGDGKAPEAPKERVDLLPDANSNGVLSQQPLLERAQKEAVKQRVLRSPHGSGPSPSPEHSECSCALPCLWPHYLHGRNGAPLKLELTELPLKPRSIPYGRRPCPDFLTSLGQSTIHSGSGTGRKTLHTLFLTCRLPRSISFPGKCKLICQVSFNPRLSEMPTRLWPLLCHHSNVISTTEPTPCRRKSL